MPITSPKQYGFMAAHMKNAGAIGGVAKDFMDKTPPDTRSKFAGLLAKKKKKFTNA